MSSSIGRTLCLACLLSVIAALFASRPATANTCQSPPSAERALGTLSAVFVGRAEAATQRGETQRLRFLVTRSFRGPSVGDRFHVWNHNRWSGYRGLVVRPGASYLVFATPYRANPADGAGQIDGLCGPTREVGHELPGLSVTDLTAALSHR